MRQVHIYRLALKDPRTPRSARWLLRITFGYLLSPLDLIPDAIPILGLLDDLIVVPGLLALAHARIPKCVLADARRQVENERLQ